MCVKSIDYVNYDGKLSEILMNITLVALEIKYAQCEFLSLLSCVCVCARARVHACVRVGMALACTLSKLVDLKKRKIDG